MRSHRWAVAGATRVTDLSAVVREYDERTRREGLHVLHDWDGKADHVNPDTMAADVATYLADKRRGEAPDTRALAVVLDYYFLYLLALLAVRIWDEGDADANLDRLNGLVDRLQGPGGSGLPFVTDARTLFLVAGSHFEMSDAAYDTLLARVRTLAPRHLVRIALTHASSLGLSPALRHRGHLQQRFRPHARRQRRRLHVARVFARRRCCGRTTSRATTRPRPRRIAEAIANGLSADAPAFLTERAPAAVAGCAADRAEFRERFLARADHWTEALEPHRPADGVYCPLALFFNFSQNVLKGAVIDAALWGEPRPLSLDSLFTAWPKDAANHQSKLRLLDTLMGYARANPDRIRGKLMPVIVYDVVAGRRAFGAMTRAIRGA